MKRRYAKGSQKTYGGWEPKTCRDCGRKLTLNDDAMCNFDHETGVAWSLCRGCLLRSAA